MTSKYIVFLAAFLAADISIGEEIDLFILAGQSNAQGWMGDAAYYPANNDELDQSIAFFWVTPQHSSSHGQWTRLKPQGGRFKQGHFGPEISLARCLKNSGYQAAIFKYTLGSTSIARHWQGPGDEKLYDRMVEAFRAAASMLSARGHGVTVRALVWIQGESDAETPAMAAAYKERLRLLIKDLRHHVIRNPGLAVILGVDEQHPWVSKNPQVVRAQKILAQQDKHIMFTSMSGLEKADSTHLTPKGLAGHGRRICAAFKQLDEMRALPGKVAAPSNDQPVSTGLPP